MRVMTLVAVGLAFGTAAEAADRSFLWRATAGDRSVYLLGSIHFMKRDSGPPAPAVERAYRASGTVVFETDIEALDSAAFKLLEAGTLDDGTTLSDVVPAELYDQVETRLDELGMGLGTFAGMRPWMVALSLTSFELMRAGYLGSEGIDARFNARAAADGKRRLGLESVDEQVALFAGMSDDQAVEFLRYSLAELDTAIPMVDDIVTAWSNGDAAALKRLLVEGFEGHDRLFRRLVTERNRRWLPQIEALFDGDSDALVVVGSLHLVGDQGLVELLRAEGYRVDQL